jgi:hypothetical protein
LNHGYLSIISVDTDALEYRLYIDGVEMDMKDMSPHIAFAADLTFEWVTISNELDCDLKHVEMHIVPLSAAAVVAQHQTMLLS